MPTPVPLLLDEYLKPPPPGSLTLATSILDATSNWLLLRLLYAAIHGAKGSAGRYSDDAGTSQNLNTYNVVLISFLRPLDFWRTEAKRLGLDINSLIDGKRLLFVDGLSQLFAPIPQSAGPKITPTLTYHGLQSLQDALVSNISAASASTEASNVHMGNTVVILDAPDLLLAASSSARPDNRTPGARQPPSADMVKLCLALRSLPSVHSLVVAISADPPLMHHSANPTPLEAEHKAFLVMLSHQARFILQLRPLESGRAKDVSGVLRISQGGAWQDLSETTSSEDSSPYSNGKQDGEWLYYINGNGEAKVWGRGEARLA